jgi:hypothetical protein
MASMNGEGRKWKEMGLSTCHNNSKDYGSTYAPVIVKRGFFKVQSKRVHIRRTHGNPKEEEGRKGGEKGIVIVFPMSYSQFRERVGKICKLS